MAPKFVEFDHFFYDRRYAEPYRVEKEGFEAFFPSVPVDGYDRPCLDYFVSHSISFLRNSALCPIA
jgi:hypothetical protein